MLVMLRSVRSRLLIRARVLYIELDFNLNLAARERHAMHGFLGSDLLVRNLKPNRDMGRLLCVLADGLTNKQILFMENANASDIFA